ncbi:ATP-NAD kinase [Colletotrichum orchidophilum]|uniref:ATP-NAD kinase n=1 Tax=Colletotrichum orchidophilum TaxID=1209926 RepID=A0A1G4B3H8_9PEZI|nr:ATP-NAD kinase [Colletotrichum orchidophilum]OHE95944.1 ATP-NAD kinase [Colletotrichum orchidophilum]
MGAENTNDEMEKRVGFEKEDDAHSSGSDDEYQKAVEVTFDPGNPYRRKSSLVTSESSRPLPRHPSQRTECIVHQFLESQRKARNAVASASSHGSRSNSVSSSSKATTDNYHHGHHTYENPHRQVGACDVAGEPGMSKTVEPKGRLAKQRASILAADSPEGSDVGQADEKSWRSEIIKSASQVDLTQSDDDDELHSRLLTKKQLSEMAWGVRELSRRLSSMRIRFRVKTIFLLTKIHDADLIARTRELTKWLLSHERDVVYTVYVEEKFKENKKFNATGIVQELKKDAAEGGSLRPGTSEDAISKRLRYWNDDMCRNRPHMFDFVISLGGDGTVLYASWLFQRIVPPVLSFSLGSLGFLTKFDFEDYKSILENAFNKGVTVSLRLRFEGTIMRSQSRKQLVDGEESSSSQDDDGRKLDLVEELVGEEREDEHTHKPDGTFEILNEIVVDRGPNPTMSYTEIFGDDEHFTSVLADGICVSTPTGSTAYNLAAGGSLCHPENPVMLVTAICAHTLSFRPIILPDTIVLRVGVPYDARTNSWASFDGRERVELFPGDYVTISASRYPFASVQAQGRRSEDWVNSISGKLGWNTRQKQKEYKEWER